MPTEFEIIFGDFSNELDALLEMSGGQFGGAQTGLTPRARIAAGNGATLLLAAIFEEYVRQQVRAAFREKAKNATSVSAFPKRMISSVWRQSLETLARTPFEEVEADGPGTDARVTATLAFCLRKEIAADISEALSHNQSNMRSNELNRLFNQIGLQSVIARSCEDEQLIQFLAVDSAGKANALIEVRLDEFFRRRNSIAHAIVLGSSSGPSELHQDVEMFRMFGRALSATVHRMTASPPMALGGTSTEPGGAQTDTVTAS